MPIYRIGVPLLILVVLALMFLLLMARWRQRQNDLEHERRLAAEKRWDGNCQFENPETGAKCKREEFHWENHYREIDGRMVFW
jgi:hypothetical protein